MFCCSSFFIFYFLINFFIPQAIPTTTITIPANNNNSPTGLTLDSFSVCLLYSSLSSLVFNTATFSVFSVVSRSFDLSDCSVLRVVVSSTTSGASIIMFNVSVNVSSDNTIFLPRLSVSSALPLSSKSPFLTDVLMSVPFVVFLVVVSVIVVLTSLSTSRSFTSETSVSFFSTTTTSSSLSMLLDLLEFLNIPQLVKFRIRVKLPIIHIIRFIY